MEYTERPFEVLREKLNVWLGNLAYDLNLGRFRFCLKGNQVPTKGQQGQISTCFAMKIAWQTGLWEQWPEQRRHACVKFIQSFQHEDGWFVDPWLLKASKISMKDYLRFLLGRFHWRDLQAKKRKNVRAETRQSASTLLMVGATPLYPLPCEIRSVEDVRKYMQGLDWRNPWSAGSHVSHQLFMLTVNHQYFSQLSSYEDLIDAFFDQLVQFHDKKTGTWFVGGPSDTIKINGAMKIFSGLQWLNRPYPDTRPLLDFALQQPFQKDGCGFLNRLFVIWQAIKDVPDGYRQEDIRRLAWEVLETVKLFHQDDGAFSFFQDHSQTYYYGASVSHGYKVSDLHGTVMLVWAMAIALEFLGDEAPDEAKYWQAHKT